MADYGTYVQLISNVSNGRLRQQLTCGDQQGELREKAKTGPFADCQVLGSEPEIAAPSREAAGEAAVDQSQSFTSSAKNVRY